MERLGLMTDAGRAVLPDMSPNGFTIDKDILQRLQSDPLVWSNFCQLPDLYRRIRIDTIQIKKNQPKFFESRLNKFIKIPEKDFSTENGMTTEDYKKTLSKILCKWKQGSVVSFLISEFCFQT